MEQNRITNFERACKYYHGPFAIDSRCAFTCRDCDDDGNACRECGAHPCTWKVMGNSIIDDVLKGFDDRITKDWEPFDFRVELEMNLINRMRCNIIPDCCRRNYFILFPNEQVEVDLSEQEEDYVLGDDEYCSMEGPFWWTEYEQFITHE